MSNNITSENKRFLKLIAAHRVGSAVGKDENLETSDQVRYKIGKLMGLLESFTRIDMTETESHIQLEAHKLLEPEAVKEFFKAPSTFIDRRYA